MNIVSIPRRCEGCDRDLPALARPNRRYHDAACRARARRRRRREEETGQDEALEPATTEERLLGQVAKAAGEGNWRASAYLLERLYPRDADRDHGRREQVDELARLRQLHREVEARMR
jgi:hypothetical protein